MNLSTDSVLFFFLFVLPGAFSKLLMHKFAPSKNNDTSRTSLVEMAEIVVVSAIVYLINIWFLAIINKANINFNILGHFSDINFLKKYILITLITTTIFTAINYFVVKKATNKICNFYNRKLNKNQELPFPTTWENIFESNYIVDFSKYEPIVSIEKNGVVISRGVLKYFSAPQIELPDFGLIKCAEIESYFKRDEECTKDEYKIFRNTLVEYYDSKSDLLIKFYDTSEYQRIQESFILQAEEEQQEPS